MLGDMKKSLKLNETSLVSKEVDYAMVWSNTLKGHKMKIAGPVIEQTGMESSGQRFSLAEFPLSESTFCFT